VIDLRQRLSSFTGTGAVAVTPHHLATEAALTVMAEGGNAVDAVIAANAVLGMALPTTCGIGGDLFAIVHRPGARLPDALNASGRAGSGVDADRLRSAGATTMPARSIETVTVPGCVDGWDALAARHGTRSLGDLLRPAIRLGREGFPVSVELAADLERIAGLVAGQPSATHLYPDGKAPSAGTTLRRPDLADTLEAIADHGRGAFYEAAIADAISAATDGLVTADDLAGNVADWVEPIGARVFGLDGWTIPPNSHGYLTLAAAILVELLDPDPDPESPDFHHAVIEAYRAVAWERNRLVADPDHAPLPPGSLLDRQRFAHRADAISPDSVAVWPPVEDAPGGTAYFCAVDGDGMAASAIQSNFWGIGAAISAGDTGVFLHNRGGGFNLTPGHPNELAPGKRPLHTLSPTLWTRDGLCALVLGTRGGHKQPQYLVQMAALMLHAGLEPGEAQASPRWHAAGAGGTRSEVDVEASMPDRVISGLVSKGHLIGSRPDAPQGWGPVSVIAVDARGTRTGAADPRVTSATAAGDARTLGG
jgi:gamma-glutamyltranspeptidase / glutathione hydrolase